MSHTAATDLHAAWARPAAASVAVVTAGMGIAGAAGNVQEQGVVPVEQAL
jgi:hypothetical protein